MRTCNQRIRGMIPLFGIVSLLSVGGCAASHYRPDIPPPPPPEATKLPAPAPTPGDPLLADEAPAPHAFAGYPRGTSGASEFTVLENQGYAIGYSEDRKDPLWASYRCEWIEDAKSPGKRPRRFKIDERTEARVKHEDYAQPDYNSNPRSYDRGHMAPNFAIGSRYGREAQLETFQMSNVCPQRSTLNQTTWEALEKRIASEFSYEFDEVWVTVGPVFSSAPRRLNGVAAIPAEFFAIVVDDDEGYVRALAVIMDQDTQGVQSLRPFVTTVREIESRTGLDFLHDLPDDVERAVEEGGPDEYWELDRDMFPSRHP